MCLIPSSVTLQLRVYPCSMHMVFDCMQTKPKRAEDKEEAEFAQMVAKYKKKLFGTVSESRWFE